MNMAACGQQHPTFVINERPGDTTELRRLRDAAAEANKPFFEDDRYSVSTSCSGEFGGTIRFKNKASGAQFACAATCPVIVNECGGKYVVTASLSHLSGFSSVLEIADPADLAEWHTPVLQKKGQRKVHRYAGDNESRSTKGAVTLVDAVGVLTLVSFPWQGD
jgi:hypothetical protein